MKSPTSWITYRTRFLVNARQLTTSLTFTDPLGRQHSGCKGDYLVESSDGCYRIAPRQIFEDIYVPLLAEEVRPTTDGQNPTSAPLQQETSQRIELFKPQSHPPPAQPWKSGPSGTASEPTRTMGL